MNRILIPLFLIALILLSSCNSGNRKNTISISGAWALYQMSVGWAEGGLATEPEYIPGDEATSFSDPISTKEIEELLTPLKAKYTIILVTHFLRQVRRLAGCIVFMFLGKTIEAAPADEFFNNLHQQLAKVYLAGSFS